MTKIKFASVAAIAVVSLSLSACSSLPNVLGSKKEEAPSAETSNSASTTSDTPASSEEKPAAPAGEEWPEIFHTEFMKSCTGAGQGVSEEYCQCTYDAARATYTLEDFTSLSLKAAQGDSDATTKIGELALQCLDKL